MRLPHRHGCSLAALALGLAGLVLSTGWVPASAAPPDRLPGIVGTDDRRPLDSVDWPWAAIGRVNRVAGGFCTGVLIGPCHVLTARHCLMHRRLGQLPPRDIHFVAGYRRGDYLAHARARRFILPEGDGPERDWAVLELANPIPVRALPIAPAEPEAGDAALMRAGFSQDRPHLLSVHGDCRFLGRGGGLLRHDCDATRGDSGSPILRRRGDDYEIVGLSVGAAQAEGGAVVGLAVPASAFREEVEAALPSR